jgi:hypothetical protein
MTSNSPLEATAYQLRHLHICMCWQVLNELWRIAQHTALMALVSSNQLVLIFIVHCAITSSSGTAVDCVSRCGLIIACQCVSPAVVHTLWLAQTYAIAFLRYLDSCSNVCLRCRVISLPLVVLVSAHQITCTCVLSTAMPHFVYSWLNAPTPVCVYTVCYHRCTSWPTS